MNEFISNDIYFAKMRADALIPKKEDENAGYDLYAAFDERYILIKPFRTELIPTGIAWACDENHYMQIVERSSTGKRGLKVSGGIIDSGYRGEIKVAIFNANTSYLVFSPFAEEQIKEELLKDKALKEDDLKNLIFYSTSKAIAQGLIHIVEKLKIKEISLQALREIPSKRGEQGWGSTNTRDELKKVNEILDRLPKFSDKANK